MKHILLATSIAALLLASPAVFADNGKGKHDKHQAKAQGHDGRHDNGLHLGHQKQAFRRGERVERIYLEPAYYVEDYRAYDLAPPPRGYRWVRPHDDQYLLVEVATGLISQILGN